MLPIVTASIRAQLEQVLEGDLEAWKRTMVHHLKEENPEINSLLLNLAQQSEDGKRIILAGYLVYKALEVAAEQEALVLE